MVASSCSAALMWASEGNVGQLGLPMRMYPVRRQRIGSHNGACQTGTALCHRNEENLSKRTGHACCDNSRQAVVSQSDHHVFRMGMVKSLNLHFHALKFLPCPGGAEWDTECPVQLPVVRNPNVGSEAERRVTIPWNNQ